MTYLFNQSEHDVYPESERDAPESPTIRPAVKAIIKKDEKFVFVTNDVSGLIMLAGGGADSADFEQEIIRECLEETNYKVEIVEHLGKTRSLGYKDGGREVITDIFVVEALERVEGDFRMDDEKAINMYAIMLDAKTALHRMEMQNDASKKGVYAKHYNSNFNVQRDYFIFKKFLEDNNLIAN